MRNAVIQKCLLLRLAYTVVKVGIKLKFIALELYGIFMREANVPNFGS